MRKGEGAVPLYGRNEPPYDPSMGTFHVTISVGDLHATRSQTVEALVDTGSTYLTLPRPLLVSLTVAPVERRPFELGDGRTVEYEVGQVNLGLDGRAFVVVCVFGDANAEPLLGSVPLETFGLAVAPVGQRLLPMRSFAR